MKAKKRGAVVATAAGAVVAVALPAWAYLTLTSNTGSGSATARSLTAPTGATATVVSATSVTVSWTLPASQIPGAQYAVTNTVDGHAVCTVAANTCADTAAIPGVQNTYAVRAVLPSTSWASAAASPSATPPPVFAVTNASGGALGAQTAGTAFQVRVAAMKGSPLAVDTAYTGARSVVFTGPAAAPNGTAASINGVAAGTASSVSFASGVATVNATLYRREASVAITATQGTGATTVAGTSAAFAVSAGPRSALFFTSSSSDCSDGSVTVARNTTGAWSTKVSTADAWGNTVANGATAVTVTSSIPAGHSLVAGSSPQTVAANATETAGTVAVTTSNASGHTRTLTSSATGLTSATCAVTGA